ILSVEAHRDAATASVSRSARGCFIGRRLIRSAPARRCKPHVSRSSLPSGPADCVLPFPIPFPILSPEGAGTPRKSTDAPTRGAPRTSFLRRFLPLILRELGGQAICGKKRGSELGNRRSIL